MTNRITENANDFPSGLTIEALSTRIRNVAQRGVSSALAKRTATGPAGSELADTVVLAELQDEFNQGIVSAIRSIAEHLKQSRTSDKPSIIDATQPTEGLSAQVSSPAHRMEALTAQVSALAQRLDTAVAALNAADESNRTLLDALRHSIDDLERRTADVHQLQQQFVANHAAVQQLQHEFAADRHRADARRVESDLRLLRAERALGTSTRRTTSSSPLQLETAPGESLVEASCTKVVDSPAAPVLPTANSLPELPFDYFLFEHRFRGSTEEIKRRQEAYLDYFLTAECVLDLGCGRGEFLELLTERRIPAIGVDLNEDMIDFCKARGLPVLQRDLSEFLTAQSDGFLGGIFVSQVVEHLPPARVWKLIQLAAAKLKTDGVLLLETINPHCLQAMNWFYLDPTHVRPYPPALLAFMCEQAGLRLECMQFSAPLAGASGGAILKSIENIPPQEAVQYQDYAVIARRISTPV